MKKSILALSALLLCAMPVSAKVTDTNVTTLNSSRAAEHERAAYNAAIEIARGTNPDPKALAAALKAVIADKSFPALSDDERRLSLLLYVSALLEDKDYEGAKPFIRRATAMANADDLAWGMRFHDDYMLKDYGDAGLALTALAQSWPQKLGDYNDDAIFLVAREVKKLPGDGYATLLNALFACNWAPKDAFSDADYFWMELVRIRLDRGDVDGAKAVAARVDDPINFIEMHADKRFDAIIAADRDRYDVAKAYARRLTEVKVKAASAPDKLEGANTVADLLLSLDRPKEALAVLTAALDKLHANPGAFSDLDDQLNWAYDTRARALFALGRSDEALAALAQGAAQKEDGSDNISQAINLADEYALYDRPKDALAAIANLDSAPMSTYGRMSLYDARACALVQSGDTAALAPVLAYMRAHAKDGEQPYLNTMLCVGDLDAAAAEVIAELADPARRLTMLYRLQDYRPGSHASPREKAMRAAWLALRARPDVAAAIAGVGRIESYDVVTPSY